MYYDNFLVQTIDELRAYSSEEKIWQALDGTTNTAGNLSIHIVGNLHHFIGQGIGNTGYVRDRPKEFSDRDVPREKMIADLETTRKMLQTVLGSLEGRDLSEQFPDGYWPADFDATIRKVLLRLLAHLAYHVGQINYHRRWMNEH